MVRSACWYTVNRHGLRPRDDKVEEAGADDAAIHGVFRGGEWIMELAY
jgi:hypothetical protein